MSAATNILYHGHPDALPEPIALRAGPLTLVFEQGDVRQIRYGTQEVVQRVYAAVRDHNWGTVPMVMRDLRIERADASFQISYTAEHCAGAVHFRWQATIQGDTQGSIRFTMDGTAQRSFLRNRIGLCVLHPMHACAGISCTIEHTDGQIEQTRFPAQIAPHQPFLDVRALRYTVAPGCIAEVRCMGDTFETEDQRNWSDASFKTYSTPLSLPFPVEIAAGTVVRQEVLLTLEQAPGAMPDASDSRVPLSIRPGGGALRLLDAPVIGRLPGIGACLPGRGPSLTAREVGRLKTLQLASLRIDLALSEPNYPFILHRAVMDSDAIGAPLDIALFLSGNAAAELKRFRMQVEQVRPWVRSWLIFGCESKTTPPGLVALARDALAEFEPAARFGSGTNYYFTEFNRARPTPAEGDLVCYSLNPQVHAFDLRSLSENLEAQPAMVASARALSNARPVHIGPVTLRPRGNPDATGGDTALPGQLPQGVDPRQMSLFGAVWTLGSLARLAESDAASVTFYETIGWRGILETAAGSPLPILFPSVPGSVFPLYHVLADVGAYAGGELLALEIRDRSRTDALALRQADRIRLLVSNPTPQAQSVVLQGLADTVRLRCLDETTAPAAMREPEAFRAAAGTLLQTQDGKLTLELLPFAVLCLDMAV